MIYNAARNPIGTVPNMPLASAPGKEIHPPILIILAIHGGQVKRDREREIERERKREDDLVIRARFWDT